MSHLDERGERPRNRSFFSVLWVINIGMSVTILSKMSPKLDLHGDEISAYNAKMKAKYVKSHEALYEETKEWCTNYRCGHSLIVAYLLKLLDAFMEMALTVIYSTLGALMDVLLAIAGPIAKITDEIAIFLCYMLSWVPDPCVCCDKSAILDAFFDFLQSIFDGVYEVIKKVVEIYWKFVGLWEKLMYPCDCDRIEADLQTAYKNELDSARALYGDKYNKYIAVTTKPSKIDEKTYYLVVSSSRPRPSLLFRKHVDATVTMYNKWPYSADNTCPAALATRAIAFIDWKTYAIMLNSNWLSNSNVHEGGFTPLEQKTMLEYCKQRMPTDLYNYVLYQMTGARPMCEIAENENWAGRG